MYMHVYSMVYTSRPTAESIITFSLYHWSIEGNKYM